MNTLEFKQSDNKNGTCDCILNGKLIDSCDMNYTEKYTQAHVVIASAWRTLRTKDITIVITGNASVGQYPISQLIEMAGYMPENMTRVYRGVEV